MKTNTSMQRPEGRTIALLAGFSVGLGILLHKIFFLVAAVIMLIVPVRGFVRLLHELEERALAHR